MGVLVSDYGIGDENIENMQLTLDKAFKGNESITLTEMQTTTVPAIAAGSWADDNGGLYKFDSEEAISTTDPVTTSAVADGDIFVCLVPSGSSITAAFTATAPTWSDSKQGWYGTGGQANNRYVANLFKATTSYTNKTKITKSWGEDYTRKYYTDFESGVVTYTSGSAAEYPSISAKGKTFNMSYSSGNIIIPVEGVYNITLFLIWQTSTSPSFAATIMRVNGTASTVGVANSYSEYETRAGQGRGLDVRNIYLDKDDVFDVGFDPVPSGTANYTLNGTIVRVS